MVVEHGVVLAPFQQLVELAIGLFDFTTPVVHPPQRVNNVGLVRQTINQILRERRAVTPAMALRLSRLFGNSPEFWLNAQHAWDLWDSEQRFRKELAQIQPLNAA